MWSQGSPFPEPLENLHTIKRNAFLSRGPTMCLKDTAKSRSLSVSSVTRGKVQLSPSRTQMSPHDTDASAQTDNSPRHSRIHLGHTAPLEPPASPSREDPRSKCEMGPRYCAARRSLPVSPPLLLGEPGLFFSLGSLDLEHGRLVVHPCCLTKVKP